LDEVGELDELLLDLWVQFSYEAGSGGRWSGGLSALEDLEAELQRRGLIDEDGRPVPPGWGGGR